MKDFPVYLLMVSYGRVNSAISVIDDFNHSKKPPVKTKFIIVENNEEPRLRKALTFGMNSDLIYYHFRNKNKAAAINYAVDNLIAEEEAQIICIDNDISFKQDYLLKYFDAAKKAGNSFYYGGAFFVIPPKNLNKNLIPYLSGSALGQPDKEFQNMRKLMFLGFSYSFFKSQWKAVNGLDERFSPGSKYDLAAEESIFQKKLQHGGFRPYFVRENVVEHRPERQLYTKKMVKFRQEQNGFTHGFQNLISSSRPFKVDFFKQLAGHTRRCIILRFTKKRLAYSMKLAYTKGFFRAFLLFMKNDDNRNYLIK